MSSNHYLFQRAEAELRMAKRATNPSAAKLHYELASRYLDRFRNPDLERVTLRADVP